jgi:hypothetical protein
MGARVHHVESVPHLEKATKFFYDVFGVGTQKAWVYSFSCRTNWPTSGKARNSARR